MFLHKSDFLVLFFIGNGVSVAKSIFLFYFIPKVFIVFIYFPENLFCCCEFPQNYFLLVKRFLLLFTITWVFVSLGYFFSVTPPQPPELCEPEAGESR